MNSGHIRKIIHHDQVGLISESQGWLNIEKSINTIYYINGVKDRNHTVIQLDRCRKGF